VGPHATPPVNELMELLTLVPVQVHVLLLLETTLPSKTIENPKRRQNFQWNGGLTT